ncbi:MAG: hypothetical protein ACKO5K_03285 [Armatimonadota bacterium]
MPQTKPSPRDQTHAFALSARLRRTLAEPEMRAVLRDWNRQAAPLRGKLVGIDAVGFLLDVGNGAHVESFHLYLRKGSAWHRVLQIPGQSDGGRRLVARLENRECRIDTVAIDPRTGARRGPAQRLQTFGGDLVREQSLRLPETPAPSPPRR